MSEYKNFIKGDFTYFFFISEEINQLLQFNKQRYLNLTRSVLTDYRQQILEYDYMALLNKEKNLNLTKIEKEIKEGANITLIGVGGYGQVYKISDNLCVKVILNDEHSDQYYHEYDIPVELSRLSEDIKNSIVYPYAIVKNQTFLGLINIVQINVLFIYITYCFIKGIPIEDTIEEKKYLSEKIKNFNISKEYDELFLKKNKQSSTKALGFINFLYKKYLLKEERINILGHILYLIKSFKSKSNSKILEKGNLIIMPLLQCSSNALYLHPETKIIDFNGLKAYNVYPRFFKMLFLQTALTLVKINQKISFTHNDVKPDNILVSNVNEPYSIDFYGQKFYFNERFRFKLADFDFSIIDGVKNIKIERSNIYKYSTWLTDIHYFVHNLFYYFSGHIYKTTNLESAFFDQLDELFIKPFCDINIKESKLTNIKTHKCIEGRLRENINKDISYIIDFLKSDTFSFWHTEFNKIDKTEIIPNKKNKEKYNENKKEKIEHHKEVNNSLFYNYSIS